jgi:microcystin-dependent protein
LIGEIRLFAGNFAPRGWAFCQGQLLPIAQNAALFSILGTTYGGDGRNTFALPDLRGRSPMGWGSGPGLTPRALGEQVGTEQVTLGVPNLPSHSHGIAGNGSAGTVPGPEGAVPALASAQRGPAQGGSAQGGSARGAALYGDGPATVAMADTEPTGGANPVANRPPQLAIYFIIALVGIFPSRD